MWEGRSLLIIPKRATPFVALATIRVSLLDNLYFPCSSTGTKLAETILSGTGMSSRESSNLQEMPLNSLKNFKLLPLLIESTKL